MEIFIAIIGLFIAWKTYDKTFGTTEDKNNLLIYFKVTQDLNLKVQMLVQQYIDSKNGANHKIYGNITFKKYLEILKYDLENDLSDKNYQTLKKSNFSKTNIGIMQKMLETKNHSLNSIQNDLLFNRLS